MNNENACAKYQEPSAPPKNKLEPNSKQGQLMWQRVAEERVLKYRASDDREQVRQLEGKALHSRQTDMIVAHLTR